MAKLEQPDIRVKSCPKCSGALEVRKGEPPHCLNCGLYLTPARLEQIKKGEL